MLQKTKKQTGRKQEFLAAATVLFYKKGYEKTSVQNIINAVKVSKGAFYHYFDSKEDVLTAIAEMHTQKVVEIMQEVLSDKKLNALEKLNRLISDVQAYKLINQEAREKIGKTLLSQMHDPKFQHQMMKMSKKMIIPLMQKLFTQGVKEGVFKTDYPEDLAEHYLEIMTAVKMSIVKPISELKKKPEDKKVIERKLKFFQDLLERLLGTKKGSIKLAQPLLKRYLKTNHYA